MENPKNQTAEVLYTLLNYDFITRTSIMQMAGILNVTARIADLRIRYGVNVTCENIHTKNKFSRPISFGSWSIKGELERKKAHEVYKKINPD